MKKRLSLTSRLMITTSVLLIMISILFTVFSLFNAYFNLIKPFEQMYVEQQVEDVVLNADYFFVANFVFLAAAIIIGCAMTYLVAKFSLKPVKIWSEEMANIDQHQLSKRIENPNTKDELGTLANAFNQLLDRLQKAFDREKRFSAAVAHELKTPLTVVKTNIEFLQLEESPEAEDYAETIEVVKKQNERMIQLVQDLMLLSSPNTRPKCDLIHMDAMISEIENDLESLLLSKNIRFEYNNAGFHTEGNAVLMKHALSNLVENAIKYNSVDGEIVISQKIEDDCYQISISDTGIGISAEDAPYIFEPFYRADKSRNRSTGGSGLGLAIAKEIIESHNGSIEYHAREPQGSEFIIRLNLEENSH